MLRFLEQRLGMKQLFVLLLMIITLPSLAGGTLLINEIQADPDAANGDANGDGNVNTSEDEFIEIYNNTGADADISGWTLADGAQVRHTFPADTVILDGCSLVLFGGGTPTGAFGNSIIQTSSTGSVGLNNGGDTIILNDGVTDVLTESYGSAAGNNQSITRDPDITGSFVQHSGATGSAGSLFSPGTQIDGSQFSGCPAAVDTAPQVIATEPEDGATFVAPDTTITINFDEVIDATASAVTLTCDATPQTLSGLPFSGSSLVVTPTADLAFDASCSVAVIAAEITDQDGTVDNMAADYFFDFTVQGMNLPIIINEFQYDPDTNNGDANGDGTSSTTQDEFVELYNNSGANLDVSGWTISDAAQVRHVFPAETVIPANCAVVVFAGGSPTGTFGNALVQTASTNSFGFNNGGDSIIVANGGNVVTSYTYNGEGNNQAATLDPDITGLSYVGHSSATGSGGALFSPGSRIDGSNFAGCVAPDNPPQVQSSVPADLAMDVAIDSNVLINFNETVDLTANAVDITCSVSGSQQYPAVAASGVNSIDIDASDFTNSETCVVTVLASNVTDVDGSADQLDGNGDGTGGDDYVFSFAVISSDTVPTVSSTVPVDGSVGFDNSADLTISFSEAIDATAAAITLQCSASGAVAFTGLPVTGASVITINPNSDLVNSETCELTVVATEVIDTDGNDNNLAANVVVAFTVGFPAYEIYEIQGSDMVGALSGSRVSTTNNIVTAVGGSGFYMQTPDSRDDNVLATSNGIFVFTGGAPGVAVGDAVDVTGDVVEFFNLTEFANPGSLEVTVISNGNPLPTALILNDSFPSTDPAVFDCGVEALERECFEGMYFEMPQGFVSAASVATFFAGSDGNDVYVKAGASRAFREPGIDYPGLPGLPVFDGNPELIEMSIEALGLPFQALSAGTEFSAKGVISFGFGDYELQPTEFTLINENVIPSSVRDASLDEFTVASANIQRFFDPIDDPGSEDDDQIEDPVVYANRLLKLAQYVVTDMKSPTIIGLQEIENLNVLTDLITAISTAGGPVYTAELIDGNDLGGIDVAYLYQADLLSNVVITQYGLNELNTFDGSLLHDRPPLGLSADVSLGNVQFPVNLLVVHMRSRGSIDDNTDGERVRSKRLQQANSVAAMVQSITAQQLDTPLYVIGDFNAFQFTDGYVDVVGQITGTAIESDNLVWSEPLLVESPLIQAVQTLISEQQYSFVFRGSAQILDNALMNDAALTSLNDIQFVRGQADANINFEDDSSSLRSTDHDGFVLFIQGNDDLIFKNGFE